MNCRIGPNYKLLVVLQKKIKFHFSFARLGSNCRRSQECVYVWVLLCVFRMFVSECMVLMLVTQTERTDTQPKKRRYNVPLPIRSVVSDSNMQAASANHNTHTHTKEGELCTGFFLLHTNDSHEHKAAILEWWWWWECVPRDGQRPEQNIENNLITN